MSALETGSSGPSSSAPPEGPPRERPQWALMVDRGTFSGPANGSRPPTTDAASPSETASPPASLAPPPVASSSHGNGDAAAFAPNEGEAGRRATFALSPELELFDRAPQPERQSPQAAARRRPRLAESPGPSVDIAPARGSRQADEASSPSSMTVSSAPALDRAALDWLLRAGSERAALRAWAAEPPPPTSPPPASAASSPSGRRGGSPAKSHSAFDPDRELQSYRANVRAALAALQRGQAAETDPLDEAEEAGGEAAAALRWATRARPAGAGSQSTLLRSSLERSEAGRQRPARPPSPSARARARGSPVRAASLERLGAAEWRREETGRGLALERGRPGRGRRGGGGGHVSSDLGAAETWNCLRALADGLARPWLPLRDQARGWEERVEGARASVSARRLADIESYFVARARESFGSPAYPRPHASRPLAL
eukprot:tig00000889_g5308.t1